MKVILIGNCHITGIDQCLDTMTDCEIVRIHIRNSDDFWATLPSKINTEAPDLIALVSTFKDNFYDVMPNPPCKVELLPHIMSSIFHPDLTYLSVGGNQVNTIMGRPNSLIVLIAYMNGLSVKQTLALFNSNMYKELGYFEQMPKLWSWIEYQEEITGYPVSEMVNKLLAKGSFLHTPNHPKIAMHIEVAKQLAIRNGVEIVYDEVDGLFEDKAARQAIWPVYNEIADRLSIAGNYQFKIPRDEKLKRGLNKTAITLEEFIEDCFIIYESYPHNELSQAIKNTKSYKNIVNKSKLTDLSKFALDTRKANPYVGLPKDRFWSKAIERTKFSKVDPVISPKFKIKKDHKVATAGSCFAQHIAKTLRAMDFCYYVAEKAPLGMGEKEIEQRNFRTFSARYGNIYTVRQLLQLIQRSYGLFQPSEKAWVRQDGKLIDCFRPLIEPNGFSSLRELEDSRETHLASVRDMFENLDVFVFTLGLTEAWLSRKDGAVLPLAPGVVGGEFDKSKYEFVNFTVDQIVEDFTKFQEILYEVNPSAKILLSVSPVPLKATYANSHVLVANTYSKSVLRVAAEKICSLSSSIDYYPSFEIITGNYNRGEYYEADFRSVKSSGVHHVMNLLVKHYSEQSKDTVAICPEDFEEANVVCDEESIDSVKY
ncbi:GSCFA domain-containing protein [Vibrio crassostreae]|uniref:GSCFA domain-containing protein n=1 Tax=Vibrio crassostreae TaxID=246167 RepID=UPI001B3010E9|nr:GSCFA domain-containing protein [Vibrio crassostreae]